MVFVTYEASFRWTEADIFGSAELQLQRTAKLVEIATTSTRLPFYSSQDEYNRLSQALRVERQSDDARRLRKLWQKPGQACAAEVDIPSQICREGTTMPTLRITGHEAWK